MFDWWRPPQTADFEIMPIGGNVVVYPLEALTELTYDILIHKIRMY